MSRDSPRIFEKKQRGGVSANAPGSFARLLLPAVRANGAHPVDAKDWAPMLLRLGFHQLTVEDPDKFIPMKGDVVVIQPYEDGNRSGHIAAFDGRVWISDFRQIDFWSGPSYRKKRPPHVFYRP